MLLAKNIEKRIERLFGTDYLLPVEYESSVTVKITVERVTSYYVSEQVRELMHGIELQKNRLALALESPCDLTLSARLLPSSFRDHRC